MNDNERLTRPEMIGARIRSFRQQSGLSQTELATKVNITATIIEDIEAGRICPGINMLMAIAYILEQEIHDLITPITDNDSGQDEYPHKTILVT